MQIEKIHIGQTVFTLDPTTPEFIICEYKVTGIRSTHRDGLFEIYLESSKYNGTSLHFENGSFVSDHFSFDKNEIKEKYKSRIITQLNDLENQIKNIRLKNWKLLCK